jgi:hypothetical protein
MSVCHKKEFPIGNTFFLQQHKMYQYLSYAKVTCYNHNVPLLLSKLCSVHFSFPGIKSELYVLMFLVKLNSSSLPQIRGSWNVLSNILYSKSPTTYTPHASSFETLLSQVTTLWKMLKVQIYFQPFLPFIYLNDGRSNARLHDLV